jgi:hypothetical protein
MAGEPIKPKSAGDVASAKAEARKGGPLPETKPSAAEDIAAFVAKAREIYRVEIDPVGRRILWEETRKLRPETGKPLERQA